MSNNNTTDKSGVGFVGLLTLIFITLKLLKVIEWSWLWVLSPIWISVALAVVILLIAFIIILIK